MISPAPFRVKFLFGYSCFTFEGAFCLSEHPDSDLWIRPPSGATQIYWEYGIIASAYGRDMRGTNGVEFIIEGEAPDGTRRPVYRRLLDPVRVAADRGAVKLVLPYRARPGESLVFLTRPNGDYSFDWAYTVRIEVK
jgi:hypothetical protein